MNISNPIISTSEKGTYSISNNDLKPLNVENAITFLADQTNSRSADHAKELMLSQIQPNSMFMPGIGIQSLAYTFLLLQMYSELETELMKRSTDQMLLTNEMYKNMANLEMKMAEDIKASGFAKGISQIAGAFANLGAAAYTLNEKRKISKEFEKNEKHIEIAAKKDAAKDAGRAQASGSIENPTPPSPQAQGSGTASGEITAPVADKPLSQKEKQALKHQKRQEALQEKQKKERENAYHKQMESAGSLTLLLGKSLDQILQGTGTIVASCYDAHKQEQEGLKHLVQMLIGGSDTQKSRLQQQYEEAAKKMEDSIQAYNAAMNASH